MSEKSNQKIAAVILAAGKGKRMQSPLPKVMHSLAGKPMLGWVIDRLNEAGVKDQCVVVGPGQKETLDFLENFPSVSVCLQPEARGTGDAVASTCDFFEKTSKPHYAQGKLLKGKKSNATHVIIATGDIPGLRAGTLQTLIQKGLASDVCVAGMRVDPFGYGRIVLNQNGLVEKIIEEKDANEDEKKIRLCNTGLIFAKTSALFQLLDKIKPNNAQSEYYLTDCVALAFKSGLKTSVVDFNEKESDQFLGINDPKQLKDVEAIMLRNLKG